jgi:hypothetical protein
MRAQTALALTLAGVLGLAGSVKMMTHAQDLQRDYKQVVPARVNELSDEIRNISIRNLSIESYCKHPEIFEQYKRLRDEQKAILDNPEIRRAVEDYDSGTIERVTAGGLGFGSGVLTLGSILLAIGYREKKVKR